MTRSEGVFGRMLDVNMEDKVCNLPRAVAILAAYVDHLGFNNRVERDKWHQLSQDDAETLSFAISDLQARTAELKHAFYAAFEEGSGA
jgi:hypothetical protein